AVTRPPLPRLKPPIASGSYGARLLTMIGDQRLRRRPVKLRIRSWVDGETLSRMVAMPATIGRRPDDWRVRGLATAVLSPPPAGFHRCCEAKRVQISGLQVSATPARTCGAEDGFPSRPFGR